MSPAAAAPGPGSVALVTGATSGIGFDVARQLLEAGLIVHVAGRDPGRVDAAMREFADFGDAARPLILEVTDAQSVADAAAAVRELDVLVNNAGINPGGANALGAQLEDFRRAYETNVFAVVAVTAAFVPALRRSAHPRIVNVSSGTASLSWSTSDNPQFDWRAVHGGGTAYRSSKTALNAVTLHTAQALTADGSRAKVNALAPGLRRTNLVPGMTRGGDPAEAAAGVVRLALLPDDGPTGGFFSWMERPFSGERKAIPCGHTCERSENERIRTGCRSSSGHEASMLAMVQCVPPAPRRHVPSECDRARVALNR